MTVISRLLPIRIRQAVRPQGKHRPPRELALLDNYSMVGPQMLRKHYALARDIIMRGIAGDLVECGTCNGGSAAAIACAFREDDRKIWLYDSFEGMPQTTQIDGEAAAACVGECVGSIERVREAMQIAKVPLDRYIIHKGWFSDTFPLLSPQVISYLHVDCDWYDSVMLTLNTFYDRVADGGVIVLDDFGHWEGCREAFYDFIADRKLKPVLERVGHTQAFWIKGRTHNRTFAGQCEIPW